MKVIVQGSQYGRWTVISTAPKERHNHIMYLCQCSCGVKRTVAGNNLKSGRSKSCGCLVGEVASKRHFSHGDALKSSKHNYLYSTWQGLRDRVLCSTSKHFHRYGGRGITVFVDWLDDYPPFKEYILTNLGERPVGSSLDRINNNGNYEPGNLKWSTPKEQAFNRVTTIKNKTNNLTKETT